MNWIEGISHTPDGFQLDTLNQTGHKTQQPLEALSEQFFIGKTRRIRATSDLRTWRPVPAHALWKALDLDQQAPDDRHQIYQFLLDDKLFLVPAQVLIKALIRPIRYVSPYAFQPAGLEQISFPILGEEQPSAGFFLAARKLFGNGQALTASLLASYSWLHCFPSANAMWHSLYREACDGRLAIKLPSASITSTFHFIEKAGISIVVDMAVSVIRTEERPYDYAAEHKTLLHVHASATLDWAFENQQTATIPCRCGKWTLSDGEWQAVEAICQKSAHRQNSLRGIVDLILTKWGTGTPWRKLEFKELNAPVVIRNYQLMRDDGRWDRLLSELRELRGASA